MPKRLSEAYIDDDGFVEDAPTSKPSTKKKQKTSSSNNNNNAGSLPGGGHVGKDGSEYWEISDKRRLTVSTFAGKQMLGIREYYEKDGEMLPGKKGISLTLEQFSTLVTLLPGVESVLKSKGCEVGRPDYGGLDASATTMQREEEGEEGEEEDEENEEEEEEEDEEDGEGKWKGRGRGKGGKKEKGGKKKKNFEDTSEDD